MKNILVPTDFSDCADEALKAAIVIAMKIQAEIHLLHIMDVPIDWMSLGNENQHTLYPDVTAKVKSTNNKLALLTKRVEESGGVAHHYLEYNSDHKAIIKFSQSLSADMIILGTKGASGLKEFFIGSLAQKVVRLSSCPVLVIDRLPTPFELNDVVIASDLSIDGLGGFIKAVDFAHQLDSKSHLVFINTPITFTETETLNKKWDRYKREVKGMDIDFNVYNAYDFEEGLGTFSRKKGNLLIMISHGSSGGLTETMVNHLKMPILSISA